MFEDRKKKLNVGAAGSSYLVRNDNFCKRRKGTIKKVYYMRDEEHEK